MAGNDDPVQYQAWLDKNITTCVEMQRTLKNELSGYYRIDLVIPYLHSTGLVTLHFNQNVDCQEEKVNYWYLKADQIRRGMVKISSSLFPS